MTDATQQPGDEIKAQLDDFNLTLNLTVAQANKLLNVLNQPAMSAVVDLVGFMNLIQTQAQPQVAQAQAALSAVAASTNCTGA
jgi:hypothetical protein